MAQTAPAHITAVRAAREFIKIFSAEIIVFPYIQPDLSQWVSDRSPVVSGTDSPEIFLLVFNGP
jgi:hypothetical protein